MGFFFKLYRMGKSEGLRFVLKKQESLISVLKESDLQTAVTQWSVLAAATISADRGNSVRRSVTKVWIIQKHTVLPPKAFKDCD